jgi:YihY family inner membrane protein
MSVEAASHQAAAAHPGLKQRITHSFPVRVIKRYLDAQGPNWATLIAWNGLFAVFPIVLVTLTVIGVVLQDPGISRNVESAVVSAFPGNDKQQSQILDALNGVRHNSGVFAIVGFVGLLWGGSALFGAMEQGLSALYGAKPRDFVRQKLMSFAMILLFTVLAVPLVLSSALLPALQSLSFVPSFFTSGPAGLLIQVGAGVLDGTLIFLAIYYVVPNRKQRLRHVIPGAIAAGVLLEAFTFVFPLYVKLAGGFNTYGATFALFFLLMTYMFFLGQITVLGGAVNAEYELSHSHTATEDSITASPQQIDDGGTTLPGKAQRERAAAQDRAR